ncbi:MAG: ABC transporter substrate-binding protein [Rhodospirillaceae bacterium]
MSQNTIKFDTGFGTQKVQARWNGRKLSWIQQTRKRRHILSITFLLFGLWSTGPSFAKSDILHVGIAELPPSLGNPYTAMGLPSGHFWASIFDPLTDISEDGTVAPSLAVKWEQTEPKRWVFSLRRDVLFHNGAPFDAQSVTTTINYLKSAEAARYLLATEVKNIDSVHALSDHEVEIITIEPDAILPRRLSLIMMIEPKLWTELGPENYAQAPVGTGPYALVQWGRGNNSATLEASINSISSAPAIKTLILTEVPNNVSREQALLSGDLDLIDNLNSDSYEGLQNAGFKVQVHSRSQVLSVALPNVTRGSSPLNSALVRQALNFAVDRPSIAKHIFGGFVEAASQGAVRGTVGFNPDLTPYPYDPSTARELLVKAGYPGGFPLMIGVLSAAGSGQELAYQKVAQDLNAVGISAEVRALPGAEFLRRFTSNDWGEYDAFSLLWNNEPMRDVGRALEYFSCLRPKPFFCDEALADDIRLSRTQADPEIRDATLQQIMSAMRELAPAIWLTNTAQITASNPKLTNVKMGSRGLKFEDMAFQP